MYCPKCSQQQTSDEMRFCSRCGFPLEGVTLLVDNDGLIPVLENDPGQKPHSSRGKMISESAYLTLIAWAVTLIATMAFNFGGRLETIAKIGALIFFFIGLIGLLRFMYAFLFVRETVPALSQRATPPGFPARSLASPALKESARAALPPQQAVPVSDYPRRSNTKEMVPRPSVTENTTRLLEDQPDRK
jgi:hypothetical protein